MQTRPLLGALAVAALVVTAGCSGLGGGGTDREPYEVPSPTPTRTETPTPGPTATDTDGDGVRTVVPGVAEDRITSVLDLVTTHTTALTNTSFAVQRTARKAYRNGTVASTSRTTAALAPNGTKYLVQEEGDVTRAVYVTGEATYVRKATGREVTYERENESDLVLDPESPISFDLNYKSKVYRYARAMSNVSVEPAEGSAFVVASDDVNANYVDILVRGDASNVTARMVVTTDGLVREFRTTYTLERGGNTFRVEERIRFFGVGSTTVPVPEWLPEAREALGGSEG